MASVKSLPAFLMPLMLISLLLTSFSIAPAVARQLLETALPEVPSLPGVSELPKVELPPLPEIPSFPVPEFPEVPKLPELPAVPVLRKVSLPEIIAALPKDFFIPAPTQTNQHTANP